MAFKTFTSYGASSRSSLTLRVSGVLFISDGIINRLKAGKAEAAVVLFDDESPKIAINFLEKFDDTIEGCRKLAAERSGVSLNIASVLRYYGVEKIKEKVNFKMEKQDDLLVIDISALTDGK